jgi:FdhD protein
MLDKVPIVRIYRKGKGKPKSIEDTVVVEHALAIRLDKKELVTLLCSPEKLDYLAVGFLCSEGLIQGREDIKEIVLDEDKGIIEIATVQHGKTDKDTASKRFTGSSGARSIDVGSSGRQTVESTLAITPGQIFGLIEEFIHRSEVFDATGGVHSAALCDTHQILVFSEDLGRHNAIDKVLGKCVLNEIPTDGHILVTSGRVSSEIVNKVVRSNIPVLISKSAPTNRGVRLAADLGITLIGFVREGRMNLYTHTGRVIIDGS